MMNLLKYLLELLQVSGASIKGLLEFFNLFGISIRNIINSMTFVNYFLDFLTWFISYIVDLIKKIGK